tara:strand:+ start:617 stop:1105 length:489 start_codon:yes stop_codon:yes gene_type:complete
MPDMIITNPTSPAEALMTQVLMDKDISELIDCENTNPDCMEPGSPAHAAVYEQVSRFKDAIWNARRKGYMTDRQAMMFTCRFIRSMKQLVLFQKDSEAKGLDAAVRAGQGTVLFVRESGEWFTKLNRSKDILCTGAYLAACSQKAKAWTFLLFTEDGDVHAD